MYIVFEGIIGTGKSTHALKLVEYLSEKYPDTKIVFTREPGGTEIAEKIRNVVQGEQFDEQMEDVCEAYLYAASRAQSLRQVVRPALGSGHIVVSDRSYLSSIANQAYGRDIGFERVFDINSEAVSDIKPDIVIYLKLDIKEGLQRTFDEEGDKFESLGTDFYNRVVEGYEYVAGHPEYKEKWIEVDAGGSLEEVFDKIVKALKPYLE